MLAIERLLAWLAQHPVDGDVQWLIELVGLLRPARGEDPDAAIGRLDALCNRLETSPELAQALSDHLFGLFADRRARHMLAETGVVLETGFFAGLVSRLGRRWLPPVPEPLMWVDILGEIFHQRKDISWVRAAGPTRWARLIALVGPPVASCPKAQAGSRQLRHEALEALRLLTHRLAALGVQPVLMRYYAPPREQDSAFLAQADEVLDWCELARDSDETLALIDPTAIRQIGILLEQCDQVLARVRQLAHEQGTSVALTHLILQASASVSRLRLLMSIACASAEAPAHEEAARLLIDLVEGECSRDSVADLFTRSTDLLALQVTENASRTGEHYVTTTRQEYWAMARSAMGAGVIVGVMALIKILIGTLHLPAFWQALAFSLNYAAGFVLVHLLHFTIATKQPAMTAARIAAAIEHDRDPLGSHQALSVLTTDILRTQWIAILGNIALAFPVSMAIALAWLHLSGSAVTDSAKSVHLIADLHPWLSTALPHAAIAGVCLFMAGIVSGFYDNRCVYSRIPERLARLPWLRRLLGEQRAASLAAYVDGNLGAIAGNIAFGFMLGFVGFFGQILGLPLDIRHVTFSAANLAYGLVGMDFGIDPLTLVASIAGIGLVALTNLSVSFALAFHTALKSRRLRLDGSRAFLGALWRHFRSHPRNFILPPREAR